MAVAARPGPSDARVPCPLCGGLIHPIAGKCKHCKADLTSYHAARPAANAPLPALQPPGGANGHAGVQGRAAVPVPAAPVMAMPAAAHEVAVPVLPPRPTSRPSTSEPARSAWRSWPVVVIILAMIAIAVAVVLMVWPAGHGDGSAKHALQPPPAPERMDTRRPPITPRIDRPSVPPTAQIVPPRGAAPLDPPAQPARPPAADLTDPDDDHDVDALDPLATPPAGRGPSKVTGGGQGTAMLAMADHLCRKMIQCGNADPTMQRMCDTVTHSQPDPPANCPAAERCLQHIDTMSCASQADDLTQLTALLTQFRDCAEAVRC